MKTPRSVAREAAGALARAARPSVGFDASRYFRGSDDLLFHNVGMTTVRRMARELDAEHADWTFRGAMEFADTMIRDAHLEAKALGIEVLARRRKDFTASVLPVWKRWLRNGYASNWATTDSICGRLIGPLFESRPDLASRMLQWTRDPVLWVRRASAVGLVSLARHGQQLDLAYEVAGRLHADHEDLLEKAVGWLLREAGKPDAKRLERYLLAKGQEIPRTTVRYAIERFPPSRRRMLLRATRSAL